MRVNIYAEEMTDRVEIVEKIIDGVTFTGLRFYLELPATVDGKQYQGPFTHRPGDDDSAAVTFWGKSDRASCSGNLSKCSTNTTHQPAKDSFFNGAPRYREFR
jgi:hypothetical protein